MTAAGARTTFGRQPALSAIQPPLCGAIEHPWSPGRAGRIAALARHLDLPAATLRSWLDGSNVAPFEWKIRIAETLGIPLEQAWSPEYLASVWHGPRGGKKPNTIAVRQGD